MSCAVWGKSSNHPGDSNPLQPRFGALRLLAFPKTKITFEREEISYCQWDSGKYDGAADGDWENCVKSQGTCFEGDWGVIVLCTMFLVSCIFFNQCVYFSYCITGYFLVRLYKYICLHIPPAFLCMYISIYAPLWLFKKCVKLLNVFLLSESFLWL